MSDNTNYPDYPMFKGLQKPLEFMGLQGRYVYWAAGTAGGALAGFMIGYFITGFLLGFLLFTVILGVGAALILIKQKLGLHSKKRDKGIFVYVHNRKI